MRVAIGARPHWLNPFARHPETNGPKLRPARRVPRALPNICYPRELYHVKKSACPAGVLRMSDTPTAKVPESIFFNDYYIEGN